MFRSYDPDSTAHDWIDDAVAFVVADSHTPAGVVNLRTKVEANKLQLWTGLRSFGLRFSKLWEVGIPCAPMLS